jgi:hypothetical protein
MTPEVAMAEPIARRVLTKALDRLDRASAEARTNDVRIMLDAETAPEIFEAQTSGDRQLAWHVLETLQEHGLGTIAFGLAPRHGAAHERKPAFVISLGAEDLIRAVYGRPKPGLGYGRTWQNLVDSSDLNETAKLVIRRLPISVSGRSAQEVFDRLLSIRERHDPDDGVLLREASAKAFWGLSKVLDNRQELVAALLNLEVCPYLEQPVHLNVHFAGPYSGKLLFIENKTSFERAIRDIQLSAPGPTAFEGFAVIYSSGYVGSSKHLRTARNVRLFYSLDEVSLPENVDTFRADLFSAADVDTQFWGDLDFAGMAILRHLRETFPSASAWRPGYMAMVAHLVAGIGHTPEEARKDGQRAVMTTGCRFADETLLPAIRNHGRFVDQEGFRLRQPPVG